MDRGGGVRVDERAGRIEQLAGFALGEPAFHAVGLRRLERRAPDLRDLRAGLAVRGVVGEGDARRGEAVAVDDVGRVINPMIVDGQITGGLTEGFAKANMQWITFDEDGSGMATVYATVFAHNAKTFEARLKALAATVCPADPRTADQLRSDAYYLARYAKIPRLERARIDGNNASTSCTGPR